MKPNPVRWFEIHVEDMPRARAFYESVFQTQLEHLDHTDSEIWAFPMAMEDSGSSGALVKMEGFSAGRNSIIIYFASEDCAIETARVIESGGRIQKGKFSIGHYGFISLVADTEGNMIGIHSMQ